MFTLFTTAPLAAHIDAALHSLAAGIALWLAIRIGQMLRARNLR